MVPADFSPCHWSRVLRVGLALGVALSLQAAIIPDSVSAAGASKNYFRIEEDWALVLLDPDAGRAAPQVATEMSPNSEATYFCNFEINHRRLPQLSTGGLQVQIWFNEQNVSYKSHGSSVFTHAGQIMAWTQYMERTGSSLKFGISQGTTVPWGDLKQAYLHVSCGDNQTNLDQYSSEYSAARSVITYGANRVGSLKLVQVRKYRYSSLLGQVVVDIEAVPRVVWDQSFLQ